MSINIGVYEKLLANMFPAHTCTFLQIMLVFKFSKCSPETINPQYLTNTSQGRSTAYSITNFPMFLLAISF